MKIGICDDEHFIQEQLRILCQEFLDIHTICGQITLFSSGKELLNSPDSLDLLLFDIEMEKESDIDVLQQQHKKTAIIFILNDLIYMPHIFGPNVYGFLLKPIQKEELFSSLEKVSSFFHQNQLLQIESGIWMNSEEILYIESDHNYSCINTTNHTKHLILKSLKNWEDDLKPYGFFRINHSCLVNMKAIHLINEKGNDKWIQIGQRQLTISRRKWKAFQKAYYEHYFTKE